MVPIPGKSGEEIRNKFAIAFAASALTLAAAAALPDAASQAAATSPGAVCPTSYTGTKYGASVNDDADWQRLSGMLGRNMCAARIFYSHALAVSGDPKVASLPTNATVVFSWKDTMTASAVTSALNSRPAGMVCYAAYYHEPEDNFTTAAQQTAYRASWATYGPAIGAAGCRPILILMRYTLSSASGRNWHAWSNPGAYDVNGWDAYNPAWERQPFRLHRPGQAAGPHPACRGGDRQAVRAHRDRVPDRRDVDVGRAGRLGVAAGSGPTERGRQARALVGRRELQLRQRDGPGRSGQLEPPGSPVTAPGAAGS